jgi:predicted dehydrogenase/threonine dehydrogenase-like Zn-dependent dehydrogenase
VRQVFLSKSGAILVEETPAPGCGAGQVAIDVAWSVISTGTETASVAGTDLRARIEKTLAMARVGVERLRTRGLDEVLRKAKLREGISAPTGYSVAGVVREAGAAVADLRPGDRVAAGGSAYAHHAEIVAVPRNLVVRVPDAVSLRAASFATVGAIALQGVRRAAPQVGENAVVVGLGLVGQLCAEILAAAGCRVIGVDARPDRVELARAGGALIAGSDPDPARVEAVVRDCTGGAGADTVLLCAGTASSEPLRTALRVVRQRGRVVVVGAVGMELEREPFYRKEAELTISCSYGPGRYDPLYEEAGLDYPLGFVRWTENRNMEAFLDLVARGRVAPEKLLAAEYPLPEAAAAFDAAKSSDDARPAIALRYAADADAARSIARGPQTRSAGKIGLAVLGAGGFAAQTLLPALAATGDFELRGVATRSSASAARVAQEFGAAIASTQPEALLDDPGVDAVVIATQHDAHARLALAALRAGKHVLLEKPMAIRRDELEALHAAARAGDRVFSVGYNRRYAPLSLRVRDALAATRGPRFVVYRVNAGSVPAGHWTLDRGVGGGRIVGELCHMLDLLAFWLGPELVAWGAAGMSSGADTTQDVAVSLQYRDASGQQHAAALSYLSVGAKTLAKEWIEVHAGGASLRCEDFAKLEAFGLGASETLRRPDKGHRAEIEAFRDAIRGRPSTLLGADAAYAAADLALRIDAAVAGRGGAA